MLVTRSHVSNEGLTSASTTATAPVAARVNTSSRRRTHQAALFRMLRAPARMTRTTEDAKSTGFAGTTQAHRKDSPVPTHLSEGMRIWRGMSTAIRTSRRGSHRTNTPGCRVLTLLRCA